MHACSGSDMMARAQLKSKVDALNKELTAANESWDTKWNEQNWAKQVHQPLSPLNPSTSFPAQALVPLTPNPAQSRMFSPRTA